MQHPELAKLNAIHRRFYFYEAGKKGGCRVGDGQAFPAAAVRGREKLWLGWDWVLMLIQSAGLSAGYSGGVWLPCPVGLALSFIFCKSLLTVERHTTWNKKLGQLPTFTQSLTKAWLCCAARFLSRSPQRRGCGAVRCGAAPPHGLLSRPPWLTLLTLYNLLFCMWHSHTLLCSERAKICCMSVLPERGITPMWHFLRFLPFFLF